MAVTIKEIAARAGVSRGTVDRVLHDRPGVKPQVAAHVRKIADELGFLPNRAGKILAARKQPLKIGCFLPGIGNAFFEDVVAGYRAAEIEYAHYGVSLDIRQVQGYDPVEHMQSIHALVDGGCGALCLTTVDTVEIRALVAEVAVAGVPVIAINNDLSETDRLCYVGTDYHKSGCVAAGLMRKMQPDTLNLLIVTGSLNVKGHNDRIRGFAGTLRDCGTRYKLWDVFESQDNDRHAYEMTLCTLREHPAINCIYIAAAGAAGVCRAVTELGRQNDVVISASDDIATTRALVRGGAIDFTICQEPWQQGNRAVQILFNYFMDGKQHPPVDSITGTVIKIRENID